jgi:hypothetical protein
VIKIASLALAAVTSISMKILTVVYGYQRNIPVKSNTMVLEENYFNNVGIYHSEASTNLKSLTNKNNFKLSVVFGLLN